MTTNWREIGDTTKEAFRAALAGSPLAAEADAIFAALSPFTRLGYAQAVIESHLGTSDLAARAKNFLGQRPRPDDRGPTVAGPFRKFSTFAECAAYYHGKLSDPTYAYAPTTTVEEFVHTYAPSSDGNDEAAYVSAILANIATLPQAGGGTPTVTTPSAPKSVIGVPVTQNLLPKGASNRPGSKLPPTGQLYVVVHETGDDNPGSDAHAEIAYLRSQEARDRQVSFHLSVDDHAIVQGLPLDETGWHAGDGCDDPATDIGCFRSIGIEGCINRGANEQQMRRNFGELIARVCAGDPSFNWGSGTTRGRFDIDHIKQHIQVSTPGPEQHHCPDHMLNENFWDTFLGWIDEAWAVWQHAFDGTPTDTTTPAPSPYAERIEPPAWDGSDKDAHGERWVAVRRQVTAVKPAHRLQTFDTKGPRVGPDIEKDEKFEILWKVGTKKGNFVVSEAGTVVAAGNVTPMITVKDRS